MKVINNSCPVTDWFKMQENHWKSFQSHTKWTTTNQGNTIKYIICQCTSKLSPKVKTFIKRIPTHSHLPNTQYNSHIVQVHFTSIHHRLAILIRYTGQRRRLLIVTSVLHVVCLHARNKRWLAAMSYLCAMSTASPFLSIPKS